MVGAVATEEQVTAAPAGPSSPLPVDRRWLGGLLQARPARAGEPRADRRWELALFVGVLLLAIGTAPLGADGRPNAPGMAWMEQATGGGLCLYRRLTGVECGGCGLTRAFVQLGHGHVEAALRLNPVAPLLFVWTLWRTAALVALLGWKRELVLGVATRWVWAFWGCVFGGLGLLAVARMALHLLS